MEADQCIIPGCHKRRCIEGDVRHPYCSKTHADEGKRRKIFRKYISKYENCYMQFGRYMILLKFAAFCQQLLEETAIC